MQIEVGKRNKASISSACIKAQNESNASQRNNTTTEKGEEEEENKKALSTQ